MMRRLIGVALGAATAGLLLVGAPGAKAACGDGPTRSTDENGNPSDSIQKVEATGTDVYGGQYGATPDQGGYIGVTGERGYLELSGAGGDVVVEGATADGSVSGQVTPGGVCVNDATAP